MPESKVDAPRRSLRLRLAVTLACIHGPFLVAPFVTRLHEHDGAIERWLAIVPVLPGLPVGVMASMFWSPLFWPAAAVATLVWVAVTAWLATESWSICVLGLLMASLLAWLEAVAFSA